MKMSRGGKLAVWFSLLSIIVVAEAQQPQVPCHFIFGDSVVDNGNNNAVPVTDAKANFPPYGIDLSNVPRGRFTNGVTVVDFLGRLLGFTTFIPPFLTARGNDTIRGVNYASGGAGIRDETGDRRGVTTLRRQVINHFTTTINLGFILGLRTPSYLNQCLYSMHIGSNDYLNNYYNPSQYPTSRIYTPEQYARVLIAQYSDLLQAVYGLGARKMAVFGLGLIGCIPLRLNGTACATEINDAAAIFNTRLQELVTDLNRRLPNAKFTYINGRANTTASTLPNYGPCCQVASGQELCVPNGRVCANRNRFIFWDAVHPTQAVNMAAARVAYNARTPSDASPFDINTLARM